MDGKSFVFRFADVEVREREFRLIKSGEVSTLEPKAFRVLLVLLRNSQKLLTKEELLQAVWGDTAVTENSLTRSIALLRRLLQDETRNPRYIETVATVGYRFLCKVEIAEDPVGGLEAAGAPATSAGEGNGNAQAASPAPLPTTRAVSFPKTTWLTFAMAAILLSIAAYFAARHFAQPRIPRVASIVRLTDDPRAKIPINGVFTDGVHLYFMEGMPWGTGSRIAQLASVGGETTWINTTLQNVLAIQDVSPNKAKLLIVSGSEHGKEYWIQPLPAGAPYRLGNLVLEGSSVSWTPDGAHVIYGNEHKILIANEDGSDPHAIAEVPGTPRWIRFSPDGRLIRFSVLDASANASALWEMHADGTSLHPLLPNWKEAPDQCCGRWSPDGNYYFLTSAYFFSGTADPAIWVIPRWRSIFQRNDSPVRLTTGPLRFGTPTPSLDGKSIFAVGEETRVELFSYDIQMQRFDPYLGGLSASGIAFSPDKKWIAWVSYPDMTLWKSRPDLSEKMQLTFPPVRAYAPRWSPDSAVIAFQDVQEHKPWKPYLVLASGGGNPKEIARSDADDVDTDPTWAPDGKSIVFARAGAKGAGKSAIYRADFDSGGLTKIPGSDGFSSPRLSPDGRYIAAFGDAASKLMLFDKSTSSWSTLAEGGGFGVNEWSPDGNFVYVRQSEQGFAKIVRVGITNRVKENVLSLKDFPALVDAFAAWYGITPDGKILLMRDRGVQELYSINLEK